MKSRIGRPRQRPPIDVLCVGLMVANIPVMPVDRGIFDVDITQVGRIEILPGGDAFNEAAIMSRLGVRAGLVGRLGHDIFSETLLTAAQEAGVDVSNVRIGDEPNTSVCIVLIKQDGSRNFCTYKGANGQLSIADIDLEILGRTRIVNIGGLYAMPAFDGAGAEELFAEAKRRGVVTSVDTKYDTYKIGFAGIRGMLRHTDYFLPSYDEAAHISGEKDVARIAEAFMDAGVLNVVIKLGGDGCYLRTAERVLMIPPVKAEVVDTTGAGDNFVAGFLTGLSNGWDVEKCGRFANAVGSLATTKVGAVTAVQSMAQVLEYEKAAAAGQA